MSNESHSSLSDDRLTALRALFEERHDPRRTVYPEWRTSHTEELLNLAEDLRDQSEARRIRIENLFSALNSKQAKIDALMLEFCPGEMSAEQRADWAKHQQVSEDRP